MKKYLIIALCLFCSCVSAAKAQLMIEEGKIKKVFRPGEKIADTLTLHNTSSEPLDIAIYLEDFEYVKPYEDGAKKFFPAGTVERSAASWISYQPKELHLAPQERYQLNYTVSVPEDASGGYYCVMFFENGSRHKVTQGQIGLSIVARVGSLFFLESQDRIKKISFEKSSITDHTISGVLTNEGNVNLVLKCLYYILDSNGVPVDRGESKKYYMPPAGTMNFVQEISSEIAAGDYTAVLTFDLEDGVSSVQELSFTVF